MVYCTYFSKEYTSYFAFDSCATDGGTVVDGVMNSNYDQEDILHGRIHIEIFCRQNLINM